jgi:hypothetical protein
MILPTRLERRPLSVIGATSARGPAAIEEVAASIEAPDKHRALFWRPPSVADAAFGRVLERSGLAAQDIATLMAEGVTAEAAIAIAERLMKERMRPVRPVLRN